MRRYLTYAVVVLTSICLPIDRSQACPTSPDVYISDWLHYIPLGSTDTLVAHEYSGTNITDWYWSYNSNVTVVDSDDEYGTYPTSSRTFSFSAAGTYYLWAEAENNYYLTDNDYGKVYVVEVSSVKQSGTGATSIYVPVSTNVSLQAYPYPNTSWPSGKPTWSIQTQPGGASASVTAGSSGSASLSNMTVAGLYRPKAVCGSADDGATMDVTAFDVQLDTTFPKTIPLGGTLALACTPKPDGITGGTFQWSKASGPGTVTFSPGADSEDPTFSASAAGGYSVQVQYTKNDATATKTSGTITVAVVTVDALPSSAAYVGAGSPLQLDCTPYGITTGTYIWSEVSGPGTITFSSTTAKNPTFTTSTPGNYVVKVQYTVGGVTVEDTSGTITAFKVDITTPSPFPTYVAKGTPIQLDCTPSATGEGVEYHWLQAYGDGSGTFDDATAKDPIFTPTAAGSYVLAVQYTLNGVAVSDAKGTTIVGVDITTPLGFPAYVQEDSPLQLDCTPQCGTASDYLWSPVSGPSTPSFSSTTVSNPSFTASVEGDYTVGLQCKVNDVVVNDTSETITVVDMGVSTPDPYIRYDEPADIIYHIRPASLSGYTVTMQIKNGLGETVRTESLTSQGLGSQHWIWDKRNDGGVLIGSDTYTAVLEVTLGASHQYVFTSPGYGYAYIFLCYVNIHGDSDNDATIGTYDWDEPIEDQDPGVLVPKKLDTGAECYSVLELEGGPSACRWVLDATSNITLRELDESELVLPYSTNVLPSHLLIDGTSEGPGMITLQCVEPLGGPLIDQDFVKVYVIDDPISCCPTTSAACCWVSSKALHGGADAVVFETEAEAQGYNVSWYEDVSYNDSQLAGTLSDFKGLSGNSMLYMVGSCGASSCYYKAVYGTISACDTWIDTESNMLRINDGGELAHVEVTPQWFIDNFQDDLDARKAIVCWAAGHSYTSNPEYSIREAAGGRWRIGYSGDTDEDNCEVDTRLFFQRMNGKNQENGSLRTAGQAWDAGGFSANVSAVGNPWTTLCPAPIPSNATWPPSPPESGMHWGGIIFDTYIDTAMDAEDALAIDPSYYPHMGLGVPYWAPLVAGRGRFAVGFRYIADQDPRSVSTNNDYCTGGGKKMDADREAPNENDPSGDDVEWQF